MATAYILTGDNDTAAHPIAGEAIIGRGEQADLLLDDITVSRRHAAVRQEGHTVVVSDLGSANGTYINDEPVLDAARACDGDILRLGGAEIRVRVEGRDPDEPTPTKILEPAG